MPYLRWCADDRSLNDPLCDPTAFMISFPSGTKNTKNDRTNNLSHRRNGFRRRRRSLLLEKGHRLRVLSRPNNDRRNLQGLNVEIVEGDLTRPESYRAALTGCQNLFHVAADYRIWVPDADAMHKININGTRDLMLAALDAKIERVVYTSSVATLGLHKDATPLTEFPRFL